MPSAVGHNGGQFGFRHHPERMQSTSNFFEDLTRTKFSVQFSNVRECNDAQRLIQMLTNTKFVELKNHSMLKQNAAGETQNSAFGEGAYIESKPSIS